MASLAELARMHTRLDGPRLAHLQRLVASWAPLADLSFADLLLFLPLTGESGSRFVVTAQIRPTTNQTVYRSDQVGEVVDEVQRPIVTRAYRSGELVEGEINLRAIRQRARVLAIPVRYQDDIVAVCTRETLPVIGRQPGELERVYVEVFQRLARMIASGTFPFATEDSETEEAPRVGDGVVVFDEVGKVEYASPNAVSALHRLGVHGNAEGRRLAELGLDEIAVRTSFAMQAPVTEEIERGPDITVLLRVLPLIEDRRITGALALLRDISDVRRRDRLLVSMDASIREIHHRVKNNLQTISSLLRIQGRRLESAEAKDAIEESVRRIRSIALVHETLSRATGDDVPFSDIVRPLVRMVEESLVAPERRIRFVVHGEAGTLPARLATPLAVVLTELLQNAVDHAFPGHPDGAGSNGAADLAGAGEALAGRGGRVDVELQNEGDCLRVQVTDDGAGLPAGFDIESTEGLGLSIVRSLVTTQLEGSIAMDTRPAEETGEPTRPGTRIELTVPLHVVQHSER